MLGASLLVGCKQISSNDRPADAPAGTPKLTPAAGPNANAQAPDKLVPSKSAAADTIHMVNDALINTLFKSLDYRRIRPELITAVKQFELTSSIDDPAATDSVITYTTNSNSFVYIKSGIAGAGSNAGIIRCQITTFPTHLPKSIYLGMSQAALARVLGTEPVVANVVLVTEQEGYQRFFFVFKKGILHAVNFESYYTG